MKKIFFTLLTIVISIQGYSQTMNDNFESLKMDFDYMRDSSQNLSLVFEDITTYSSEIRNQHYGLGQGTLGLHWDSVTDRFSHISYIFQSLRNSFESASFHMQETADNFVNFNGSYSSLSGLPSLFDGNFSSLSGTPTTLAGYGITDAFDGSYNNLTNKPFEFYSTNNSGIQSPSNVASASYAVAVGDDNTAQGPASIAMGKSTRATGEAATSAGFNTAAEGDYSFAIGRNSIALDDSSVAAGFSSEAQGANSIAMGTSARATRNFSTAIGYEAHATGLYSTAMGSLSTASGPYSTVTGYMTEASGDYSTAMGYQTEASGNHSTAMGYQTEASELFSTAMGRETKANGFSSTAVGFYTTADDYSSLAIGLYNKADETPNPNNFSYQNTAFVIGNGGFNSDGAYDGHLSNAFEVLFDGTTTIAGDLNINSDARLKANIISLGSTLSKLLQIDGKTYTMKKDESEKQKIGLLAQDIEKVFPELVSESHGVKSVNYQGLVPILINALKEQDEKMKSQQLQIDELRALVQNLIN